MCDFNLSKKVINHLSINEWYKERKIETDNISKIWLKDNYKIFESAIHFSQSFGDLKIIHEAYKTQDEDYSILNPIKATENLDPAWVFEEYNLKSNSDLLPIGVGYSEHLTYFIDPHYHFYGGFDDYFCKIGSSINEFFENIFFEKNFIDF